MKHLEERTFDLRVTFRCHFDDDYDGDEDGYVWAEDLAPIRQALLRAVVDALSAQRGWRLRGASRGRAPDDEALLVLERALPAGR